MRAHIRLAFVALLLLASGGSLSAWQIRIATWNLLNFSERKAGLPPDGPLKTQLLDNYANIISQYDIVVLQEILNNGVPLTTALALRPALANYDCQTVSLPSGRTGRQEVYGVCYATAQLALTGTFDWMAQATAQAFVPPPRVPQQVWMRPPLVASFTYTPPGGVPFHFSLNINHTKYEYSAGLRPQGTPPAAHDFDATHYELWATQQNAGAGVAPLAVLGDLNADCLSYPPRWRGQDFTAGWNWYPANYGVKTNVAAGIDCAYDRIILNTSFNHYYRADGVHKIDINQWLNGFRVSDHYLVWVEVGDGAPAAPPALAVAAAVPATSFIKRVQAALAGGGRMYVIAAAVSVAASAALYITAYDKDVNFQGNRVIPLTDVRGAPTPVTLENGGFVTPPVWDAPVSGAYKLVLDVNGDGKYVKTDGDVANLDGEIDFLVSDSATAHGSVVTRGDNGQLRELFNEASAHNVYAEARLLPPSSNVDLWVVSTKLLPATFTGWAAAIQQGTLNLASVSAPVNVTKGPLILGSVTAV
ncbi:MAG TPA: endonuclease/exonuclease/phosphatase family protein, partial [Thermoanaerobaculia bacterium]